LSDRDAFAVVVKAAIDVSDDEQAYVSFWYRPARNERAR